MTTGWHGDWDVWPFNGGLKVAGDTDGKYFNGNADCIDFQFYLVSQVCRDVFLNIGMVVRVTECQGASVALEFPAGWNKLGHSVDENFP